jgi:hypothetical protein
MTNISTTPRVIAALLFLIFLICGYKIIIFDDWGSLIMLLVLMLIGFTSLRDFYLLDKNALFPFYKWAQLLLVLSVTPLLWMESWRAPSKSFFLIFIITAWFISVAALKMYFSKARTKLQQVKSRL